MLFEFSLKTSQTDREDGELNRVRVEEELKLFDSLSCLRSTVRDFVVTFRHCPPANVDKL